MRKSTLFISAALTTFILAILAGAASAYQSVVNKNQLADIQTEVKPQVQTVANPLQVTSTPQEIITPEQAAELASKVLGRDDLYSVEPADLDGVQTYLVTFSSGDLVYVGLDGQILSVSKIQQQVVISVAPASAPVQSAPSNRNNSQSYHEHENEHEDDND